jgi:hypothetical protein
MPDTGRREFSMDQDNVVAAILTASIVERLVPDNTPSTSVPGILVKVFLDIEEKLKGERGGRAYAKRSKAASAPSALS